MSFTRIPKIVEWCENNSKKVKLKAIKSPRKTADKRPKNWGWVVVEKKVLPTQQHCSFQVGCQLTLICCPDAVVKVFPVVEVVIFEVAAAAAARAWMPDMPACPAAAVAGPVLIICCAAPVPTTYGCKNREPNGSSTLLITFFVCDLQNILTKVSHFSPELSTTLTTHHLKLL